MNADAVGSPPCAGWPVEAVPVEPCGAFAREIGGLERRAACGQEFGAWGDRPRVFAQQPTLTDDREHPAERRALLEDGGAGEKAVDVLWHQILKSLRGGDGPQILV